LREEILKLDSQQAVSAPLDIAKAVRDSLSRQRVAAIVLGVFAGFAVVLALIGIYGVTSLTVNVRSREIGIRIALGARARDVYKLIVGETALIATCAVVTGCIVSGLLSQWIERLLFRVGAIDPITFASAALVLTAAAVSASYFPARRATGTDPALTMRAE
jgi:ABC-type antimicrobial peptide transport system permease subunit